MADFTEAIQKWSPIRNGHNSAFRGEDKFFDTYCVPKLGRHEEVGNFRKLSEFLGSKGFVGNGTDTVMLLEEADILVKFREWFIGEYPSVLVPTPYASGWIDLAQHHGAPTRLLDVSRNPLVGLFFACWNPVRVCDEEEDGIVWIKEVKASVRQQSVPRVEYLSRLEGNLEIQQGIAGSYFDFFEPWAFSKTNPDVDHFYIPPARNMEVNRRVYAQQGHFIWNTKMHRCGQWFPILVPKKAKRELLQELDNLYVNPFMLFPGKEGEEMQSRLSVWLEGEEVDELTPSGFDWEWPGKNRKLYYHLIPKPSH